VSLLIVAPLPAGAQDSAEAQAGRASAQLQGFDAPSCWRWPGGAAWLYPTPEQPAHPVCTSVAVQQGEHFAIALGSFHWRGQGAQATLQRLLASDIPIQSMPWDEISGAFMLLLCRADGVWLLGDALGLMKVYQVQPVAGQPVSLYSSSLLACCAALPQRQLNRLRAQEYVLLGATHGLATPIDGVALHDPVRATDLRDGRQHTVHAPQRLLGGAKPASLERATQELAEGLGQEFEQLARAHGGPVAMALSGGFDSRLLLAGLTHSGCTPELFVYGRPQDEDVRVAGAVARRLGLPIEVIDKASLGRDLPPMDTARLRNNLRFFDGLPVDGVFDRGMDQRTRHQQVQNGRLNLNGGGGEIFRNFFYLPDRSYSAEQICATFYSGWQPQVFHTPDERQAFLAAVQDELLQVLGHAPGHGAARRQPLPRAEVELLYTLFRLRYWMGRNNSLATRYGAFMTPLVTPGLVCTAAALPLRWKDFGRLEAAVIRRLAPDVAAGPSAYGFSFADGPGKAYQWRTTATLLRPAWLRAHSLRVQALLGRVAPPTVPPEWAHALGEAPRADLLNLQALTSQDQINRLMTIQALMRGLDA
jgi:hypothetical protein